MKRIVSMLLAVLLLVSVCPVGTLLGNVYAAEKKGLVGECVTEDGKLYLSLYLDNVVGLCSIDSKISYDTDVLEPDDVIYSEYVDQGYLVFEEDITSVSFDINPYGNPIRLGGYFLDGLHSSSYYASEYGENINGEHFLVATIEFDIIDSSYSSTSFEISSEYVKSEGRFNVSNDVTADLHVHTLTKVAAKAATCTTAGNKAYYKCTECGKFFKDSAGKTATTVSAQKIKAKGHTLTKVAAKAATCTKTGNNAYYKCSVCSKVFKDSAGKTATTVAAQTIKAKGHTLKYYAAKAATSTAAGNKAYYKCTVCGGIYKDKAATSKTTLAERTIAKHTHKLTKVAYKAATCTATGNYAYYKCSGCSKVFTDAAATHATTVADQTIAKKAHKLTKTAGVAPTCTKKGNWAYYTCSVCGKVFSDAEGTKATTVAGQARKATGHKLTKVAYKAATCTATGHYTYYKCSVCSKVYIDSEGKKVTTVAEQTIAKKSHKLTKVAYKAATCTATGHYTYYKCSVCSKVFVDSEGKKVTSVSDQTIAKKAHTLTKVAYKAATCTAKGHYTYYKCSVCSKVFVDSEGKKVTTVSAQTIAAKGHDLVKVPYKAATYTTTGNYPYYKCSRCSKCFEDADGEYPTTAAEQKIAVIVKPVEKVLMKDVTVYVGDTDDISDDITAVKGKKITYSSTNKSAVTVSSSGVVKAVGKGFGCVIAKQGSDKYYYYYTVRTTLQKKIYKLQEKYPHGYYWNNNTPSKEYPAVSEYPCTDHSSRTYSKCKGQCAGFANLLSNEVFGSSTKRTYGVTIGKIKIGDVVRITSGHSVFIIDIQKKGDIIGYNMSKEANITATETKYFVAHCNWDCQCGIEWQCDDNSYNHEFKFVANGTAIAKGDHYTKYIDPSQSYTRY